MVRIDMAAPLFPATPGQPHAGCERAAPESLPDRARAMSVGAAAPSARPRRCADDLAEIATPEGRVFVGEHVGLDVAEGSMRLVPDTVVKGLYDLFLEAAGARMRSHDRLAFSIAVFGVAQA